MKNKIMDKISNTLEKLDEKQLYAIFGGILVLIFILDYLILMKPQLDSLSKINPKVKFLSEDIKKAKDDIQRLDQYRNSVNQLKTKVEGVNEKIKSREEVPLILEQISVLANEHGVKIDQIMPDPENSEILLEQKDREFYTLPILIEGRVSYHNFGRFINKVENENEHLDVGAFTLSTSPDTRFHKLRLTLIAIVYEDVLF